MMGSQAIAEQADNLLSIIGDNKAYAAKIKEMKELAQALTAEKDRLAKAQAEANESVTQVSNDRAAIEKAAATAQANLKEAQTLREQAQEKFEAAHRLINSKGMQLDQQAAEQIARANALDILAGQIEARAAAVEHKEKELEVREADVLTASKEMKDRLARLKDAVR
jgi:predicted  nucleic acid-binding Zn-ribbon protein